MLTESFLNSCFSLLLNCKVKVRRDKSLYRDILEILDFYEKTQGSEIPITLKSKFDCLKRISEMLGEGKTPENSIDSVVSSEKYKHLIDFLCVKQSEELKDCVVSDIVNQVRLRKKLNFLLSNFKELNSFICSVKEGTFESLDNVVEDYETVVRTMYANLMEQSRMVSIESSCSLDLEKDDYGSVIEMIKKKYERVNVTPTGFDVFDNDVFNGGFEPSRLYVFGGGSGSGKSTLLNNFIIRSATLDENMFFKTAKKREGKKVFVYVTLENTIEEALLRTYQPLFDRTVTQVLQDLVSKRIDLKSELLEYLTKTNSTVIMKYFPATTISSVDLMMVLDDAISQYGKDAIVGLYVDYLDLLKTDVKYDMYRLELGHITLCLKNLAVDYNIPVITATQIGRSVYKGVTDARALTMDLIGESIKKVEHADFVAVLSKDKTDQTTVHLKVGKNRSGKSDVAIDFKVDFTKFKFINGFRATSAPEDEETKLTPFGGLGFDSF